MQKITEKIAALPKDGNYFSLEFFPPKTQAVRTPSTHVLDCQLMLSAGLFESSTTVGAYVPCASALVRDSDLGRWG